MEEKTETENPEVDFSYGNVVPCQLYHKSKSTCHNEPKSKRRKQNILNEEKSHSSIDMSNKCNKEESSTNKNASELCTSFVKSSSKKQKRMIAELHKKDMELVGAGAKFVIGETFKSKSRTIGKIDKIAERLLKKRQEKIYKSVQFFKTSCTASQIQTMIPDDAKQEVTPGDKAHNGDKNQKSNDFKDQNTLECKETNFQKETPPHRSLPNILSKRKDRCLKSAPNTITSVSECLTNDNQMVKSTHTTFVPYVEGTPLDLKESTNLDTGNIYLGENNWVNQPKLTPRSKPDKEKDYTSSTISVTQLHSFPYLSKFPSNKNLDDLPGFHTKAYNAYYTLKNKQTSENDDNNYRILDELNLSARSCFSKTNNIKDKDLKVSENHKCITAIKSEIIRIPSKSSECFSKVKIIKGKNDKDKSCVSTSISSFRKNSPTVLKKLTFLKNDGKTTTYTYQPLINGDDDRCNSSCTEDHKYTRIKENADATPNKSKQVENENTLLSTISRSSGQIAFVRGNKAMGRNKTQYFAVKHEDRILYMPTNDSTYTMMIEKNNLKPYVSNVETFSSKNVGTETPSNTEIKKGNKNVTKTSKSQQLQSDVSKATKKNQSQKVSSQSKQVASKVATQSKQLNHSRSEQMPIDKTRQKLKKKTKIQKKRLSKPKKCFVSHLGLVVKSSLPEDKTKVQNTDKSSFRGRQRHAAGTVYKTPIVKHAEALRISRINNNFTVINEKVVITLTNGSVEELKSFQKFSDKKARFIYEDAEGEALKYIEVDDIQSGFYQINEFEDAPDINTGTKVQRVLLRNMPATNGAINENESFIAIGTLINLFSSQPCQKVALPREVHVDDIEPLLNDLLPQNQHFRGMMYHSDMSYRPHKDSSSWYADEKYDCFTELYCEDVQSSRSYGKMNSEV